MFLTAGTIVSVKHPDLESVLPLIEEYGITYVINSIPHTKRIVEQSKEGTLPDVNFDSVKVWFPMGQAMPKHLAVEAREIITENIYTCYGNTEGLLDTVIYPDDLPDKAGKDGYTSYQNQLRIIEQREDERVEPTETVERGELGEIITKSPVLPKKYYNKPEESAEAFYKGWFYTDDLGVIDEDGVLSVKGRVSDMIISGGENIAIVEVEEAIMKQDGVNDVAVIGVPDDEWGETVKAFVVAEDTVTEEDLDKALKEGDQLADYKRPRLYEFVSSLPKTETGKIQRQKLREQEETND
jgi:fatty-acyl-CoA synthase